MPSTLPSMPSMPSPSGKSGSKGDSGEKSSKGDEPGDMAGTDPGSAGDDFPAGDAGGGSDTTLSDALEAFEKARGRSGSGDGEQPGDAFESTDFPMVLAEESRVSGDGLESGGAQGGSDPAQGGGAGGEAEDGAAGAGGGAAQTSEEKLAVLDEELQQSYGQFEGMILRERDYVRGKENARGTDLEPLEGEGAEGSGGDAVAGSSGEYREPISGSGSGNRPENPDQREGDFEQVAVVNQIPPDIPDGSDDDVVARQLREAAMKESDPELREKLWEEYKKYKNKGS